MKRRRLKQANFPFTKTIDELDLSRYDGQISDLFISELASCRFIDEKKNLVMIGNPGRGKTHMAIGIGHKACASGKSVLFKNAASLSTELSEANEYSRAVTPQIRQAGNRLSRLAETAYANLLA